MAYSNQSTFCFQFLSILSSGQQPSCNATDWNKTARKNGLSYTNEARNFERSVENNGSLGDLDDKNDEFIQIASNQLNFIKHSLRATLIGTPVKELTFDSNSIVRLACTCLTPTNNCQFFAITWITLLKQQSARCWLKKLPNQT